MGFRVQGLGFGNWGFGFRVWDLSVGVQVLGFSLEFRFLLKSRSTARLPGADHDFGV